MRTASWLLGNDQYVPDQPVCHRLPGNIDVAKSGVGVDPRVGQRFRKCHPGEVQSGFDLVHRQLLAVVAVAVGTYLALYALTTWLGTFA